MMNFLFLWRGISLGSDALWKLKQRSVTQLSVVFLLVITKKYTISGVTFSFKGKIHSCQEKNEQCAVMLYISQEFLCKSEMHSTFCHTKSAALSNCTDTDGDF